MTSLERDRTKVPNILVTEQAGGRDWGGLDVSIITKISVVVAVIIVINISSCVWERGRQYYYDPEFILSFFPFLSPLC